MRILQPDYMIDNIFSIGFHYKSLTSEQRSDIFRKVESLNQRLSPELISSFKIKAVSLLKTCNRWELYGYGAVDGAISLLTQIAEVSEEEKKSIQVKTGSEALHYIFKVAAGLDSMVLGDQEILSQFKKSFKTSKNQDMLDGYMERLANVSLQAAKEVRKQTAITSGTTSLSYAAIHILRQQKLDASSRILVLGLGKFGNSIAKNISEYFPQSELTVCNRTLQKASDFAKQVGCETLEFDALNKSVNNYDVIISALETDKILLKTEDFSSDNKIIIDLSMPSPFDKEIKSIENINYYSIEDAAALINKTWKDREESISSAQEIVSEYIESFKKWSATYSHSSVLKEWKNKLSKASTVCPFFQSMDEKESSYYIQKSMGHFAKFVKSEKAPQDTNKVLKEYLQQQH